MSTCLITKNTQAIPPAVIRVWHEGADDYRVHIEGIGEHSKANEFDCAIESAAWLASLSGPDFGYEILMTLDAKI